MVVEEVLMERMRSCHEVLQRLLIGVLHLAMLKQVCKKNAPRGKGANVMSTGANVMSTGDHKGRALLYRWDEGKGGSSSFILFSRTMSIFIIFRWKTHTNPYV